MKKFFEKAKSKVAVVSASAVIVATNASAALTAPTLDTSDATTVGSAMLGGLAAIWVVKKVVGMMRG